MKKTKININRAPVLTLWGAVVAERLGYAEDEALTLGRAVAGYNAQSKGRKLGLFKKEEDKDKRDIRKEKKMEEEQPKVKILKRSIPVIQTEKGVQAVIRGAPISPGSVRHYLEEQFGKDLSTVRTAMEELATAYKPAELEKVAYSLYEEFRPEVPEGVAGWGARGVLDLHRLRSLAE